MKRNLLILILALLTCLTSFGQATKRERNLIKQGNEYFNKKQYSKRAVLLAEQDMPELKPMKEELVRHWPQIMS